jgi:hypothetical protein
MPPAMWLLLNFVTPPFLTAFPSSFAPGTSRPWSSSPCVSSSPLVLEGTEAPHFYGGAKGIPTCSLVLLRPAIHRSAIPNRRTWQQRNTRDAASFEPRMRRLRFGFAGAHRPKPREFAGISRAILGCAREVSATTDWVAVWAVWSELVSAANSLITRENTGNFLEIRLPWPNQVRDSPAFPQS